MKIWSELKGNVRRWVTIAGIALGGLLILLLFTFAAKDPNSADTKHNSSAADQDEQPIVDDMVARNQALLENLQLLKSEVQRLEARGKAEESPTIPVTADGDVVRTIKADVPEELWIPLGTVVLARLENRIISSHVQTPVIATIPYTMRLDENKVIEKGSRFIGASEANFEQQRVFVHFHHMITPDFKEVEIDGDGLDPYGSAGLSGIFHSNEIERLLSMFGYNLVGAVTDLDQEYKQSATGIPFKKLTARNIMLEGSGKTAKTESERLLQEAASHKDEKIEIQGQSYLKIFFNKGFYSHATR